MKENDLFEIIGDIDDAKIKQAYSQRPNKFVFIKRLSFAACFVLIATISFSVTNEKNIEKSPVKENIIMEYEKGGGEVIKESPHQQEKTEIKNQNTVLADTSRKETENEVIKQESCFDEDSVVTENDAVEEASDCTSGGGGGSSGSSALRKEEFSIDYLDLLNGKIIEKMANAEFSFIISSRVDKTANRVEVLITSIEEELIEKVKELDNIGGAIEFKLSSETMEIQ